MNNASGFCGERKIFLFTGVSNVFWVVQVALAWAGSKDLLQKEKQIKGTRIEMVAGNAKPYKGFFDKDLLRIIICIAFFNPF